ncbi:membrane progestin receptor beta-like [Haliotis rufescens]|uniref:membrane progestin receptor beta-like n=1 Tax=Haliotis rufescens TaxID=6454 RepID=UPI00201F97EC|nr:membrane progestin receptor beta-like [Haliotis rufescens]XP_046372475.2 membrane progestin receptor beta-like [Haliotis rufescens]XP_046372476.2 membrane progestin receptor beta-like [Haliotis rufescens]
MLRSELTSLMIRAHHLLRKQPTFKSEEVPMLYREPGVLTGYRLPGMKLVSYIISVLQLNNEVVNVWTHLIGFVVVLFKIHFLLEEFGPDDSRIFPVIGFGVCCLVYTSFSVIAHTLHSISPVVHYTCFQVDYAGIALYAFGGSLSVFYTSADSETKIQLQSWFLPVNFTLSWFCFLCCCIAKLKYRRPYPISRKLWQVIPYGVHTLFTMALVFRRTVKCYSDNCSDPGLYMHGTAVILAFIAALTFSSHLPEKVWPGLFDLIGQGHHVFHVVSIFLTLKQFDAAHWDILHSSIDVTNDVTPKLSSVLGVITGLCVCCVLTILALRPFVTKVVQDGDILEKKK